MTTTSANGKFTYEVKQTGNKFFYYSKAARRWMPVKAELVDFDDRAIFN